MFAFSQLRGDVGGIRSAVDVPFGEYLSVAFEQGVHDSMFHSVSAMRELDMEREGDYLTPEELNRKYAIGTLKFDRSTYEGEARLLRERKEAEMRRQYYLSQGNPGGIFSARGMAGIGAGFLGSVLNPLDLSVNFLPIVGSEVAAGRLAAGGAGLGRRMLARGLITGEEVAQAFPRTPGLVTSLIQGGVGNLVAEIPHAISELESKADYTSSDAVVNVVSGTLLSGALHLAITAAVRAYSRVTAPTRERMLREAVDQFVRGEEIRVEKYVEIDENVIREGVRFNEAVARERALRNLDIEDVRRIVREQLNERVAGTAVKIGDKIFTGETPSEIHVNVFEQAISKDPSIVGMTKEQFVGLSESELEEVIYESAILFKGGFVTDKGRFISREEAARLSGIRETYALDSLAFDEDPKQILMLSILERIQHEREDLSQEESFKLAKLELDEVLRKNQEEFFNRPDVIQAIDAERERRVRALIESERQSWDEEGRFRRERAAEIQRQVDEGRTLTPEQVREWGFEDREGTASLIKDQLSELEAETRTLGEELGEDVDKLREQSRASEAAIRAAVDCVLKH